MADAADLKSAVFGRAGSSPAFGTDGRFARRAGTGAEKKTRRIENADTRGKIGAPRGNARPLPAARLSRSRRGNKKKRSRRISPRERFFRKRERASSHLRRRREATSASAPRPASRPNADGSGTAGDDVVIVNAGMKLPSQLLRLLLL